VIRKGWARLGSTEEVERAAAVLEEHGWVYAVEVGPGARGGRPTTEYHLNARLQEGVR
jgi:hypothetical protein